MFTLQEHHRGYFFGRLFAWNVKKLTFKSSFKGNFFGALLRVGVRMQPPSFYLVGVDAHGVKMYRGSEYNLLKTLAKSLNFKKIGRAHV